MLSFGYWNQFVSVPKRSGFPISFEVNQHNLTPMQLIWIHPLYFLYWRNETWGFFISTRTWGFFISTWRSENINSQWGTSPKSPSPIQSTLKDEVHSRKEFSFFSKHIIYFLLTFRQRERLRERQRERKKERKKERRVFLLISKDNFKMFCLIY